MADGLRALRVFGATLVASTCGFAACAHRTESPPTPQLAGERAPEIGAAPGAVVARASAPRGPLENVQVGYASWYGRRFAGRRTANGERFDPEKMTAAHLTIPFGTWVEVRRVDTGRSVRVRITDRGPFGHADRIIDLSRAAARRLGLLRSGMARVEVRIVKGP
jgi:rare lipoprotein A